MYYSNFFSQIHLATRVLTEKKSYNQMHVTFLKLFTIEHSIILKMNMSFPFENQLESSVRIIDTLIDIRHLSTSWSIDIKCFEIHIYIFCSSASIFFLISDKIIDLCLVYSHFRANEIMNEDYKRLFRVFKYSLWPLSKVLGGLHNSSICFMVGRSIKEDFAKGQQLNGW